MTTNDDTPPATKTYRVWADHVRRMFQDVDAPDPQRAHEIARDRPECWEDCFEVEDRDDYHLSDEVQDIETEEYHRVCGATQGKTRDRGAVGTSNEGTFRQCGCGGCEHQSSHSKPALLAFASVARCAFKERISTLEDERQAVLGGGGTEDDCRDLDDQIGNYRHLIEQADAATRGTGENRRNPALPCEMPQAERPSAPADSDPGFPGVPFGSARLRVVLSGGADFDDEDARLAAQHLAVMAMHPGDADGTGGGPGGIIADLEQFPDAGRYAALFAAAPRLRRASQELYDRLQDYLDVSDAQLTGQGHGALVDAMDALEAAWREADRSADDPPIDTPEDAERRIWRLRLAADRERARRKESFRRYPALHAEEKIRLALEILGDVSDDWDHNTLEHYPDGLGSFDEFLAELGMKLGSIRWSRPGRPPADPDGGAA
jgi:hypothetical protein